MRNAQCTSHINCRFVITSRVACVFGVLHLPCCFHFLFHYGEFARDAAVDHNVPDADNDTAKNGGVDPIIETELLTILRPHFGFEFCAIFLVKSIAVVDASSVSGAPSANLVKSADNFTEEMDLIFAARKMPVFCTSVSAVGGSIPLSSAFLPSTDSAGLSSRVTRLLFSSALLACANRGVYFSTAFSKSARA